ncbi:MAG: serine hydrolase domain-containing protein [bacterium]
MHRNLVGVMALLVVAHTAALGQSASVSLDSAMHEAERNGFSGVVRVEKNGVVLLERGYGMANRATKIAFTPATIVQIGSNTKDFTAVAILQLVEDRKISLADSIGRFFRSAPADKRNITITQLLTHRAGFPLGIGDDFEVLNRQQLVDRAMTTPLLFVPGARENYSNTGYSLLAAIVEQIAGTSYDVYLRDRILTPLGLTRTGLLLPGFRAPDLAHGYLLTGADAGTMLAKPHAADGPYWNLRGNGGMLSTVGEMQVFYKALLETDKLMKPATRALRFNPDEPIGLAGSDGVNFFLYERFPRRRTEILIASTNAAFKAPAIRRILVKMLSLPDPDGGE